MMLNCPSVSKHARLSIHFQYWLVLVLNAGAFSTNQEAPWPSEKPDNPCRHKEDMQTSHTKTWNQTYNLLTLRVQYEPDSKQFIWRTVWRLKLNFVAFCTNKMMMAVDCFAFSHQKSFGWCQSLSRMIITKLHNIWYILELQKHFFLLCVIPTQVSDAPSSRLPSLASLSDMLHL